MSFLAEGKDQAITTMKCSSRCGIVKRQPPMPTAPSLIDSSVKPKIPELQSSPSHTTSRGAWTPTYQDVLVYLENMQAQRMMQSEVALEEKAAHSTSPDEKAAYKTKEAEAEAKDNPRRLITPNMTNRLSTGHISYCSESAESIIKAVAAAPAGSNEHDTLGTTPCAPCASVLPRVIFRGGAATIGGTIYLRLGCSVAGGSVLDVTVVSRHVLRVAADDVAFSPQTSLIYSRFLTPNPLG